MSMMEKPLISVIVPAYQAEKWLEECCQSVYSQTYSNWELIIIDDGSKDRTLELARREELARTNVRVIHTENGGVSRARNLGMEAARGTLLTFLDADDCLAPDALMYLHTLMEAHHCDIAVGNKVNVREDGTRISNVYPAGEKLWSGGDALMHALQDHPATYSVWGKLYKRSLVENIRFVEGKKVHEDSFFIFECMRREPRVVVSDRVVLYYRLSQNSASRAGFSDKFLDILYFAERKKEIVESGYPQYNRLAENVVVKANMALLRNLCKTRDPRYRRLERECLAVVRGYKRSFVRATAADQKWFRIIICRLYWAYKLMYRIKYRHQG